MGGYAVMCCRSKARSHLDLAAGTTSGWCAICWRAWENKSLSLNRSVSLSVSFRLQLYELCLQLGWVLVAVSECHVVDELEMVLCEMVSFTHS